MKKEICLDDVKYFDLFIGKRVVKAEVFKSKGTIPVYSANVFEPFGFLNMSNINDFSCDYILWSIDGEFGFNVVRKGTKFATTDHCGAIKILDKNILPEYLRYKLELQSHLLGFDRTLRSSLTNMKKVIVKLPIDKNGQIDLNCQKDIIRKYTTLKSIKEDLKNEKLRLSRVTIDIDLPKSKNLLILRLDEIFDLEKSTNSSSFTKEFINSNKGEIPVYSASQDESQVNYGYVRDNLPNVKYFEDILTWNIDGSVGKAFFRKGRFSLSEKVIPLILRDTWRGLIDYTYVKYVLEKEAVERGFTFSNKAGKSRIKDIEIKIPAVYNKGKVIPDIAAQMKLAKKYETTYSIKDRILQCLQQLHETKVEI